MDGEANQDAANHENPFKNRCSESRRGESRRFDGRGESDVNLFLEIIEFAKNRKLYF